VSAERVRISGARITPVAFDDPPLLNAAGVHEPYALRAIIQLDTAAGLVGLGETHADEGHLRRLGAAAGALVGKDVFALNEMHRAVADVLAGDTGSDGHGLTGAITMSSTVDRVFSPFEVACLDVQGKILGRPVSDLLGGAVRDRVQFSAYLFYKWAAHPGRPADSWGEARDPDGIVAQARRMVDEYGFTAIKLKGGVLPPEQEVEAVRALRAAFPGHPLRIDPNAAWTVPTSVQVARELDGIIEYLEDPTPGLDGMAEVARHAPMPLATNMCVVAFDEIAPSVARGSVSVILSDHHYWGGLTRSKVLSGICETFGLGLSMHSNSHLAPGHQPGGDGAPGRRDAEPDLCLRHPLAVEDAGRPRRRRAELPRWLCRRAGRPWPGRRTGRGGTGHPARALPVVRPAQPRRHGVPAVGRAGLRQAGMVTSPRR
jgi:glucarate dehydratase